MRALVQRVSEARVRVDGEIIGEIEAGSLALIGVTHDDTPAQADKLADKIANLRIFTDDAGKMNLSVLDIGGSVLVVSQFTLYGDTRKGRRPAFVDAARRRWPNRYAMQSSLLSAPLTFPSRPAVSKPT